jgi:hypothetical protein
MGQMGQIEAALSAKMREAIRKGMNTAARQSIPVLSARVWDAPPASNSPHSKGPAYASGAFLAGWEVGHQMNPISAWVFNKTAYAGFVDNGVKASTTKMGALAAKNLAIWVRQKGIKFTDKNGRVLSDRQMAWLILRAMNKRRGWRLRPRKVGMRAVPRIKQIFRDRIREAMERAAREAAKEAAKKKKP